jgi:hypothetical protein
MVGDCPRHRIRREVFALILCLLAVVFAFEAKTAWYLPPHTIGSEVQAAKALPADTPQVIPHGLPDQPLFFLLSLTVLIALTDEHVRRPLSFGGLQLGDRSPSTSSAFSPYNFYRPPPVR